MVLPSTCPREKNCIRLLLVSATYIFPIGSTLNAKGSQSEDGEFPLDAFKLPVIHVQLLSPIRQRTILCALVLAIIRLLDDDSK